MENVIDCPVCSKKINKCVINEHVNVCLNSQSDVIDITDNGQNKQNKKRKSDTPDKNGWGFMKNSYSSGSDRSQKRVKLQEHGITTNVDTIRFETFTQPSSKETDSSSENVTNSQSTHKQSPCDDTHTRKSSQMIDLSTPLAEQMRPKLLEDYVGQEKAVGKNSMLRVLLQSENIPSMLFWGPPGCGKTTLGRVIAHRCKGKAKFVQLSATSSGVNDVKEVIRNAKNDMKMFKKRTLLFLDEIHRFNKTQQSRHRQTETQDSLLPHVEDGTITLIGATTENPSFQVNSALLSRCRVVSLEKLDNEQLLTILIRATERLGAQVIEDTVDLQDLNCEENADSECVWIQRSALQYLSCLCDGDARQALNSLQMTVQSQMEVRQGRSHSETREKGSKCRTKQMVITSEHVKKGLEKSHISYDKTGEEHYNCVSALIKSMRGSDDSAALYWLARMLEGGETPLFVARRLVIFASEDVGLADSQALPLAVSTYQACHFLGMPECQINLAHCVVYLARAPKSIESFEAYKRAKKCVQTHQRPLPSVPLHLRNAPTKLMKDMGYGEGYKYNPAHTGKTSVQQEYLPAPLIGSNFFK